MSPFQNSLNPQYKFSWAERFCDVIIRTKLKTDYPVHFLPLCSEHDYRYMACGVISLNSFTDFSPFHTWQHYVQNNKGRFFLLASSIASGPSSAEITLNPAFSRLYSSKVRISSSSSTINIFEFIITTKQVYQK